MSTNTDFDVVIVGGGAAGIGAARTVVASGRSALLLEASSRLGGRAWTLEIAGHRLDLGCGWMHSADPNSWTRIAEEAGAVVDRRRPAWGVQHHACERGGQTIDPPRVISEEPTAVMPHGGICGGEGQQWLS